jgi:7-carboxy-7-deazaguanine synthase
MRIAEIFHSIQGEGSLTGVPSVFVRASGCNLRCAWCDTPYASWSPEGAELSVDEIIARVRVHGARHVVLTGGEPMIARDIRALAAALHDDGLHITIETAATIPPDGIACDLASLSPKLANSTPATENAGPGWARRHEELRWRPQVVRAWIEHAAASGRDHQIKIVVCAPRDLDEIDGMLREIGGAVSPDKVFLMPEGVTLEALRARQAWLVEACLARGYRYAHRLQIELFGNTRGT